MRESVENYVPQRVVAKARRRAFLIWLAFIAVIALWNILILSAPLAAASNFNKFSGSVYSFFSYLCHQIPSRSFFLENHQFAVCARCFGVYFGLLSGTVLYPFLRPIEKTESFPRFWLFLTMIPMAIDWSLGIFEIWENTYFSRFATGMILGATCAIYILPAVVEIFELFFGTKQTKRLSR